MKKYIVVLIMCIFFNTSIAQGQKVGLIAGGGISFIGTGDLKGLVFANQIDLHLTNRLFVSPGLQFTNYSRINDMTYFQLRYVTTGISLYANFNYYLVYKARYRVALGVGPSLRYQTTSVPTSVRTYLISSGEPILDLEYSEPMSTLSPGYNISPSYYYQFSRKLFFGAKYILNNDTRGDINSSGLIFVGVNL